MYKVWFYIIGERRWHSSPLNPSQELITANIYIADLIFGQHMHNGNFRRSIPKMAFSWAETSPVAIGWHRAANATPGQQDVSFLQPMETVLQFF